MKNKGGNYEPLQVDATELLLIQKAESENVIDNHYRPIKLNKHILLQSGFRYVIEDCYSLSIQGYTLAVYYHEHNGIYRLNNRFYLQSNANKCYVHQFQNLIHTLMGIELQLDFISDSF